MEVPGSARSGGCGRGGGRMTPGTLSSPAIAIGVTPGGGEHAPEERIYTTPPDTGLGCAAATIAGWEGVGR